MQNKSTCNVTLVSFRTYNGPITFIGNKSFDFFMFPATASYRLLPDIKITKPCEDELADKLVGCFSEGVIKVKNKDGMLKILITVASLNDATLSCS